MNTAFIITGHTPDHVQAVGQWFANRVAVVYQTPADMGSTVSEMPVAVLVSDEIRGVVPALRKITKADLVHIHIGPEAIRKAQGSDRFYHLEAGKRMDPKDVGILMRLEGMWRAERVLGRSANERPAIHVPV